MNCFKVNGNLIMLVTSEGVAFYSDIRDDITKLKGVSFREAINGCSGGATCCRPGFRGDGEDSFLLAAGKEDPLAKDKNAADAEEKQSWLFRCKFDEKEKTISYVNQKGGSGVFDERVSEVLEYAPDKLIVHVQQKKANPFDLLILHSWKMVRRIRSNSPEQCRLAQLPGFDEERFPFLVSAG